ncbi:FAD-dependent oxidoreductase [Ruminococcus sp. NK3A76]|uniref:NAD(P)/FAD-dependent oxidoreductase n=1 Tax=Ruminococcus sp. NK3A76 TaxID=877411 RepID=UPI00048E575D|nr:FAD-dependent oxidoreductase [Ruminococcus sp. NK3A76]
MFDIIIVGAGPAGLTAAIYAQRAGRKALVFEAGSYGGQIIKAAKVENYPGLKSVSGFEFAQTLYDQATALGAEIRLERVIRVADGGSVKTVTTDSGEYQAKAVILATGAKNRPLGLENEKALTGKGVSYCATCDGMFFRGKSVVVAGGERTAVLDALFLADICEKVYVVYKGSELGVQGVDADRLSQKSNVELMLGSRVTKLIDEGGRLSGIEVTSQDGVRTLDVQGLFVAVGNAPDNSGYADVAKLDDKGYFCSDESCLTVTPGIFVAGDCRAKKIRQLTTAAADGTTAALAACSYLRTIE